MGEKKIIEPEFLSTVTIARRVDRSSETIRREINRGRLRAIRFNGDYLIKVSDFEEWKAKYFKPVE